MLELFITSGGSILRSKNIEEGEEVIPEPSLYWRLPEVIHCLFWEYMKLKSRLDSMNLTIYFLWPT